MNLWYDEFSKAKEMEFRAARGEVLEMAHNNLVNLLKAKTNEKLPHMGF